MFALKPKGKFTFICSSEDDDEFNRKINAAFANWRARQPQGSNKQLSDFMEGYDKVEIAVKPYSVAE